MPEETTTEERPEDSAPAGGPPSEAAAWDDGVIARRARPPQPAAGEPHGNPTGDGRPAGYGALHGEEPVPDPEPEPLLSIPAPLSASAAPPAADSEADNALRVRLTALRELVGLSRTRLPEAQLAEATRVLDEAAARTRLPRAYTCVAIAGATGSGKSALFNAMAGAQLSESGVRRPTTATAVSCTWDLGRATAPTGPGPLAAPPPGDGVSADGLLERLAIPTRSRRRAHVVDAGLRGLVLLDLPDFDSVATGHREQVDRLLSLVDAVIWVVDPEKYADALLHERYLRAFAGHAEISVVALNQTDRLPPEAAEAVLDDLRRLLDERGVALGEHGEPGAAVLGVSALTGEGVPELKRIIGDLVASRTAAARRLTADVDQVTRRLRPMCVADSVQAPLGLTPEVREDFEERLAHAVGAPAAGQAAERGWLRRAERSCGTPWSQLAKRLADRRATRRGEPPTLSSRTRELTKPPVVAQPVVAEAVREVAAAAATELPPPWAASVRDAAWRGCGKLPRALESALAQQPAEEPAASGPAESTAERRYPAGTRGVDTGPRDAGPPRPAWWLAAIIGQAVLLTGQLLGMCWLLTAAVGYPVADTWLPVVLLAGGSLGAPLLAWVCRVAARAPARAAGQREEERLRSVAARCGRSLVLEPVAAELLRYREVREQYVIAAGGVDAD